MVFFSKNLPPWRYKKIATALCVLLLSLAAGCLLQPCLFIRSNRGMEAVLPAVGRLPIKIYFIHSVQKTPVEEDLIIQDNIGGFLLQSTKYQSFGVGLPFLATEGEFYQQGNFFVLEHMDRVFPFLSLRTGLGTQLRLEVAGREYRLYEQLPPGSLVDLYLAPYYRRFFP